MNYLDYLSRLSLKVVESSLGEETPQYKVFLLLDNKKIASVENEGIGGCGLWRWNSKTKEKKFFEFIEELKKNKLIDDFEPEDTIIHILLDEYDEVNVLGKTSVTREQRLSHYYKSFQCDII